jgi:hypothetical protein
MLSRAAPAVHLLQGLLQDGPSRLLPTTSLLHRGCATAMLRLTWLMASQAMLLLWCCTLLYCMSTDEGARSGWWPSSCCCCCVGT